MVCQQHVGNVPLPEDIPPITAAWMGLIRRHLTTTHSQLPLPDVQLLAERLTLLGSPDNPDVQAVYRQIQTLLLTPMYVRRTTGGGTRRITHLRDALEKIPPDAQSLTHLATTMAIYRRVTGRALSRDKFRRDRVVETMLAIPDPEAYITRLHDQGLSNIAAMFHPNTLEHRKKDPSLRGVFHDGMDDYDQDVGPVRVIRD